MYHQCGPAYAQGSIAVGHPSLSSLELVMSIGAAGLQVAHSRVVYVTPNATAPCPKSDNSSCHTLSWYSHSDRERLLSNDTVVILLKGTHILNSTIHIENRKNLTIAGEDGYTLSFTDDRGQTPHPVTWINCTSSAETGIVFLNFTDIKIVNIGFDSCGTNVAFNSGAGEFNVSAALFFGMSNNVSINQVIINNTYGSGLHMNCVFGNIWINDSILVRASKERDGRLGCNAKFQWFGQSSRCKNQCSTKIANLAIFRSWFMQGLKGSIGIEIIIDCPQVYVLMSNVNAINNTGGNIALSLTTFDGYAPTSSKVHIVHSIINGGRANTGGGIRVWSRHNQKRKHTHIVNSNNNHIHSALLTVWNTNFSFNSAIERGGAVYISHHQSYCIGYVCQVENVKILFKSCSFMNNIGNGAAMETKQQLMSAYYSLTVFSVSLDGCLFHGNSVHNNKSGPIVNLIMTYMTVSNCSFTDNSGSALMLLKSDLNFHGDIRFENNQADYGSALRICEASLIFLNNNTHISFTNNTAFFKGGAVYTYQSCVDVVPPCLFQPHQHKNVSTEILVETLKLGIDFVNNSASIAGDAIYGGSLDYCFFIANFSKIQSDNMLQLLNMSGQTGPSWVSSDPQGVCFCDDNEKPSRNYECRKEHPVIKVYPGAKFNVSMITVGQMNGSTPGSIVATLDDSDKDGSDRLIVYRGRNATSSKCENITFTLQSKRKLVNILFDTVPSLTSSGPKTHVRSQSASLTVSFKTCPFGFFKNKNHSCDCNPLLCEVHGCLSDLVCDIDKQKISTLSHAWIGCLKNSSLQSCKFAFSHRCVYCIPEYRAVNIFHLDDQCLPGRTGIICGACKSGLSRILEQFRMPAGCMKCSNSNLAFLIPLFLFSEIILVIFLTIFNMTVTEGAINGLIFYTSVAYAHPNIFRTDQPTFLWVFVSWLNLDLGFEICAYNGMTGYQHIWLLFGYIFCLIFTLISIIYLSHKFIRFTRLIRRNAINVLATIIIFAYNRVFLVCYHSFNHDKVAFNTDYSLQPKFKLVWIFDGNIPYLGPKHIPLFVLAIIFLLAVLWLTFSLLLIQCLQKRSNIWCLRWVERLRPFFEAYTGPCNDNCRFWPGFLLLLRLALFVVSAQKTTIPLFAGICFLIIPLACIFPHGIYKKWPLNILELLFVLNLGITFLVVQFTHSNHVHMNLRKRQAAQLSTSFAFIMFFGILLYHIYRKIKGTPVWKKPTKLVSAGVKKLQGVKLRWSRKDDESDDEKALLLPQPLPPVIKFPEYRELLLEN